MSFLDTIKNAGGDALHFGDNLVHKAESFGSTVVRDTEKGGEALMTGVQATEQIAVKSFRFEGDMARIGLEKTFSAAQKADSIVDKGLDRLTHPGDPNPPAAQGLKFSETKGASDLAYSAKKGETYKFPGGEKWTVADVKDDQKTGFRAIALKSNDPNDKRVIVAYAGTRDGKDWKANIGQGLGLPTKQYNEAVQFAGKWKASAGDNVILTGHSLGGGLASYASIKTGLHATAVNSAPLALDHLGLNPFKAFHITQYYVPGEALSVLNKANNLDIRPGFQVAVQGKNSILDPRSVISNHSLDSVAPAIAEPVKVP